MGARIGYHGRMLLNTYFAHHALRTTLLASAALVLAACSPYVGVSVPVGPFSVGVGGGSGGMSVGVGTGIGPVGVGVGVNQNGQVTGSTGVGVGTSVGGANVGVGVSTGTVLYDPAASPADAAAQPPGVGGAAGAAGEGNVQWRGADGKPVADCKMRTAC